MKKVSDLTPEVIGKRMRIQTMDGAFIEGTVWAVVFTGIKNAKAIEVGVSFEEIGPYSHGKREHTMFATHPNRDAFFVEEEVYGPPDTLVQLD